METFVALVLTLGLLASGLQGARGTVLTYDPSTVANRTFDYVIVGGGTSGLTVRPLCLVLFLFLCL